MEFITSNWQSIVNALAALIAAATIIVGITPSQKDDAVLAKIVGFLNYFSVVNPKKTKE